MTTNGNGSAADAAALQAIEPPHRMTEITLESGIRLRLKPVSPVMLRAAAAHLPRPKAPVVLIEEKGRSEENPNDPDFIAATQKWFEDTAEAGLTVALVLGTEIIDPLPEGVHAPDSTEWSSELMAAHDLLVGGAPLVIRPEGKGRYLDWLRMYAIATNTDLFRLTRVLTAGVSLSEEEVNRAAASFRSVFAGPADLGSALAVPPGVGADDRDDSPGATA